MFGAKESKSSVWINKGFWVNEYKVFVQFIERINKVFCVK